MIDLSFYELLFYRLLLFRVLSQKTLYGNYGIINSQNWPQVYPPSKDCYWKIDVGDNNRIKIAFMDFDLEYDLGCGDDKLKVKGEKAHRCLLVLSNIICL